MNVFVLLFASGRCGFAILENVVKSCICGLKSFLKINTMPIEEEGSSVQESSDIENVIEDDDDKMLEEDDDLIQENDDDEEELSSNWHTSDEEDENTGNSAWADAMCRVLNTNVSKDETFILSKAKKITEVKSKDKSDEIELVDDSGNLLHVEKAPKKKSLKEKRREMIQKQNQKAAFESMCRVKPDITNKDRERELIRIATRGVVHLFNTVEKHQNTLKNPKEKRAKKKESLGAVKGTFMDILKGQSKKQILENDPIMKKAKQEESWNILKDDFMMGAEMKDWDKDSDDDQ